MGSRGTAGPDNPVVQQLSMLRSMRDREKDPLIKQALSARINEVAAELPATKDPLDSLRDVLRVFNEITA
eukprot:2608082-Prorocentrum_lima.AAC.1